MSNDIKSKIISIILSIYELYNNIKVLKQTEFDLQLNFAGFLQIVKILLKLYRSLQNTQLKIYEIRKEREGLIK